MSKKVVEKSAGETKPSQFRLGESYLAMLDDLVSAAGAMETRSSVLRRIIAQEHAKLQKRKERES